MAAEPALKCPGQNTIEQQQCARIKREQSANALQGRLTPEIHQQWSESALNVCRTAYSPYLRGSIYSQMVTGCMDRLNRALLEEMKGLGE